MEARLVLSSSATRTVHAHPSTITATSSTTRYSVSLWHSGSRSSVVAHGSAASRRLAGNRGAEQERSILSYTGKLTIRTGRVVPLHSTCTLIGPGSPARIPVQPYRAIRQVTFASLVADKMQHARRTLRATKNKKGKNGRWNGKAGTAPRPCQEKLRSEKAQTDRHISPQSQVPVGGGFTGHPTASSSQMTGA